MKSESRSTEPHLEWLTQYNTHTTDDSGGYIVPSTFVEEIYFLTNNLPPRWWPKGWLLRMIPDKWLYVLERKYWMPKA